MIDAELLDVVDGATEPVPGIKLLATPGHRGDRSVVVNAGAKDVIVSGDTFVHPDVEQVEGDLLPAGRFGGNREVGA